MFSKATANFVRQVDPEGSLLPARGMNDSSKLLPMALVVKRKRHWFWQRPKYQTTDFTLNDLLLGGEEITPAVFKTDFLTYMAKYGDKITGKLDAKVTSVGVKLEAQGSSKLQSDFGKLKKEAVDVKKLLHDSDKRLVNMEHVLVQELEKRYDVLAVVKESILSTGAFTVTQTKKERYALSAVADMLGKLGATINFCIEENTDIETDMDLCLETPPHVTVVIAYSVLELKINKDGHFKICLQPGKIGGGFEADTVESWSSQDDLNVVDGRCFDEDIPQEQPQQNGSHVEDLSPLAELSPSTRRDLLCMLKNILTDRVALSHLQSTLDELCFGKTPDMIQQEKISDCVDTSAAASLNAAHLLVSALEELPEETLSLLFDSRREFLEAFSTLLNLMERGHPLSLQFLPTLLCEKQDFQQAKTLLSSIGLTMNVDNNQLWLEMGEKIQVHLLVLSLSTYGLSLLCGGQK
ncbi:gasdermin-E-like [Vanacampus margaritifer]